MVDSHFQNPQLSTTSRGETIMEDPKDFMALISHVEMRHLINSSMGTSGVVVDDPTHAALYALELAGVGVEAKLREISGSALLHYQAFKARQVKTDKHAIEEVVSLEDTTPVAPQEVSTGAGDVSHEQSEVEKKAAPRGNPREVLKGREISDREFRYQVGDFSQFRCCTCVRDVLIVLRAMYHARWMEELQERM